MRVPFIEIENQDYNYANENYKMLHDRPVWNIFLDSGKYINNHFVLYLKKFTGFTIASLF